MPNINYPDARKKNMIDPIGSFERNQMEYNQAYSELVEEGINIDLRSFSIGWNAALRDHKGAKNETYSAIGL